MESVTMDNGSSDGDEKQDGKGTRPETAKPTTTAENFQKYMYDLFEKNGVMNDLRSYLRGHIVNVLRSAHTGRTPSCQKHFTQRLERTFQALNILIAEYLMCLKFGYSLSVFISEIPLANMVFSFAKTLMEQVDETKPRFKDSDIWCILNYLGLKCDSEHAKNVLECYKMEQNSPLLICILKTSPLYMNLEIEETQSSPDSASTTRSSEILEDKPQRKQSMQEKCRHYVFCKACQSKASRIREKYKKKKKDLAKVLMRDSSLNSHSFDDLMKNISVMEKNLIDEMFEQLKSVYETEMNMMKEEEEKRVKKSLASHSNLLQKKKDEMEESFKARELELQNNVEQKKRFLWGLAHTLRAQHCHMTRAMQDVRQETQRLAVKEESLKAQIVEAEEILRKRGEVMRQQISKELTVLEAHLEDMKKERDNINRERTQLEQYKSGESLKESEDLKPHYDLLKNEFAILRKYLETAKLGPKCVIERSTLTDLNGVTSRLDVLNNVQDVKCEDRPRPKQLVNDLKKPKNVNFSLTSFEVDVPSRSSATSSGGDAQCDERDALATLQHENEQLRAIAREQRSRIDSLVQQARMSRVIPTPRPRTAPPSNLLSSPAQRMNSASVNNLNYSWRKGAGEDLSFFGNAQPRIVVPGESIPFVGVVSPHTDNRRYLLNQWRSLRRRISPRREDSPIGICKSRPTSPLPRNIKEKIELPGPSSSIRRDHEAENTNQFEDIAEQNYQEEYYNQYGDKSKDNQVIPEQDNFRPAEYPTAREYETRPEKYQSRPEQSQTRPGENQKRPEQYQTQPEKYEKGPEQYQTQPEQYEKGPEQYQTRPEQYQPMSNQYQNRSDQYQNPAEEYQTRPDQYQERAEECQAGPGPSQMRPEKYQLRQKRELSPQTMLREAKEKLRCKEAKTYSKTMRDKSPNCLLRDAKQRLRKLEIEAEAVEKSYLEFMRKQEERKRNEVDTSFIENKRNIVSTKCSGSLTYCVNSLSNQDLPLNAYDKYFKEYQNYAQGHFKNNNAAAFRISPIPNGFSTQESAPKHHENYVEQPLTEFRKYYITERNSTAPSKSPDFDNTSSKSSNMIKGVRQEIVRKAKNDQKQQLELLKQNIGKIYNMPVQAIEETLPEEAALNSNNCQDYNIKPSISDKSNETVHNQSMHRNLLKIEVQSISEINDVKVTESQSQDVMLIVESSAKHIDNGDIITSDVATTEMCIIVSPKMSLSINTDVMSPRRNEALSERTDMITTKSNSRSVSPKLSSRRESIISKGSHKVSGKSLRSPNVKKDLQDSIHTQSETHTRQSDQTRKSERTRKSVSVKSKMTTDDVVAIFHEDTDDQQSSEIMKANGSKSSDNISFQEENEELDYPDDFSADVDNYNNRSDYGDMTPVPKTSEDENFWDS